MKPITVRTGSEFVNSLGTKIEVTDVSVCLNTVLNEPSVQITYNYFTSGGRHGSASDIPEDFQKMINDLESVV
jgi:hypothetical protein